MSQVLEKWKPIIGYEDCYEVSNLGRIKSLSRTIKKSDGTTQHYREKIMKPGKTTSGYAFIILCKNKRHKNYGIHRLVAQAFIPNPNEYLDVNHIDGNKLNNIVSNLEWCTRSDNLKHALKMGLVENQCKIRRKVIVRHNEETIIFDCMKDCCEYFGYKKGWLQNRIRKHGCSFYYGEYHITVCERG